MEGQSEMSKLYLTIFLLLSLCFSSSLAQNVDNSTLTALQKHVMFFDMDGDGIIYPSETYKGFRAIGFGHAFSLFAAGTIGAGLSAKTRPGQPIDLKFPIVIKNINLAKHESDTGAYDEAGRFVDSKFEDIFAKHAHTDPNSMSWEELQEMVKANKKDNTGSAASTFEWKALFDIAKNKNGVLEKETARAVFDGSLFQQLAQKKAQSEMRWNANRKSE